MMNIDREFCMSCGFCANRYPETFKMSMGKVEVISNKDEPEAVNDCPARAISQL